MTRTKRFRTALLAALLSCVVACSDSNNSFAPQVPVVVAGNLAPAFAGLKAIATAGGGSVRLCWEPANDDSDAPGQIRYRLYVSTVRGGQNFGSSALETAPGTTCITIAAAQGARSFYVVRAVDTENAEETNRIEVSVTPLAVANVRYVDASNTNAGNGSLASPFRTIQEGVDAAEALGGGGIVLVATGTYDEQVRATVTGTAPLHIFGGFPPWGSLGVSPTPEQILQAFDAAANPTTVDGTGLTTFTAAGEALVYVSNSGRPTCIGGLRVVNAEEIAIGGVIVDLEISCCSVRDPEVGEIDNVTQAAVQFLNLLAASPNLAVVVGSDLREFSRSGVEASGFTSYLQVSGNFIGRAQANSDSTTGVGIAPAAGPVLTGNGFQPDTILVPTDGMTMIRMENNEIFRTNRDGIFLDFSPEVETAPGTLQIEILGNEISFIEDGAGIDIDDFLWFGDGGSGSLIIDHNRLISTEDAAVDLDLVSTQTIADGSAVDGPTTITITNNWMALNDDGVGEIDDLIPPAGGTCSLTFENNQGSNIESTALDVESFSPAGPGPIDGVLEFTMRNNRLAEVNGSAPDVDFDTPPGANGLLSLLFEGNLNTNPDDDTAFDLEIDSTMGTNPEGTVYNQTVTLRDNIVLETSDASEHIELDCFTSNGTTDVHVMDNFIVGGGGIAIFHDDSGSTIGPLGTATIHVGHNFLFVHDDEGIEVDADATGLTVIDVVHNYVSADEDPIALEVSSGNSPNGRVHTTVFNNRIDSSDDDQLEYFDATSATNGEAAYLFAANNTLAHGVESSGTDLDVQQNGMMLFANNFVGFGEVDSDDGLDIDRSGANPGLVNVRNNIFGFIPGDAVDLSDTNTQFINNTVAYNGMGGNTNDFGIVKDGEGRPYILNSIVYRNGVGDLDPSDGLLTSYSLIGDQDPSVGFGDVVGDPILNGTPDLFAFNLNYMLRPGSPAIDAGHPSPQFNDTDGTRNDLGAFGGPGSGWVGSFLPDDPRDLDAASTPDVPLCVVGVGRPFDSNATLAPMVDMHAGSPLRPIGPNDLIHIVFTIPVQEASLGGIGITADGVPVAGTFVLRNGGRVAAFVPAAPVAAGDEVSVNVGSAVLAAGTGAPLAVPFADAFGTLPAATPETEDAAGPDSNGTTATAQTIAGVPTTLNVTGTIFDTTDTDYYSFTASAGERLQATVVASRLATANISPKTLTLFASDGTTVLTTNAGNAGTLGGTRNDPFVDIVIPATGTYYLQVTSGTGTYELHWFIR